MENLKISGVMDSMKNSVDSVTGVVDRNRGTPDDVRNILNETLGEFQNISIIQTVIVDPTV